MDYKEYLRRKALVEFYEGLSEDDKRLMVQSLSENEKFMEKLEAIERKVDVNHHSFGFGVLENVAGNAAYDAVLWILRKIAFRR